MAALFQLEARSGGQIKVIRTADELVDSLRGRKIAMVLHFEGAEAIDPELNGLHVFYRAGCERWQRKPFPSRSEARARSRYSAWSL